MIIAGMATIASRTHLVKQAIASLLPQIDKLYITLNGYTEVPSFVKRDKIEYRLDPKNSLADNAKLLGVDNGPCYYLTVDDDIIYPKNYASEMVKGIERHDRRAVIGVHGIIYKQPLLKYPNDRIVFGALKGLDRDRRVHAVGTGTAAFSIPEVPYTTADIPSQTRMIDVHLAGWCNKNGIEVYTISRPAGWLKMLDNGDIPSIWRRTIRDNPFRKSIKAAVKSYAPWPLLENNET